MQCFSTKQPIMLQPVPFAVSADLVSVNLIQENTKGRHFSVSCNSERSKIIYPAAKGIGRKINSQEVFQLEGHSVQPVHYSDTHTGLPVPFSGCFSISRGPRLHF